MVYGIDKDKIPPRGKSVWIAKDIEARIHAGEIIERLPSERELASLYNVNFKTVSKALSILVDRDLLYRRAPHGTFVKGNEQTVVSQKDAVQSVAIFMRTQGHLFEGFAGLLIDMLNANGFSTTISGLEGSGDKEFRHNRILSMLKSKPNVLIVGDSGFSESEMTLMEQHVGRIIYLTRRPMALGIHTNADFILSDPWFGAYSATRYLINRGRKKIMMLTHHITPISPVEFRYEDISQMLSGYHDAMTEAGLQDNAMVFGEYGSDQADLNKQRLKELLASDKCPDAIFATQDFRIARHLNLFRQYGLKCTDDMVGYFNTVWCYEGEAQFSSISINEKRIAELIVEHLTGSKGGISIVKPELIIR